MCFGGFLMNLNNITSVDKLKDLGSFKAVKELIQVNFGQEKKIKARGWQDLYTAVVKLKEELLKEESEKKKENNEAALNKETKNNKRKALENSKKKASKKEKIVSKEEVPSSEKEEKSEYFLSKASEFVFYLVELDGETRMEKLGVTKRHFTNKKIAKTWMRNISKEIHPDKCKLSKAEEAMSKLNSMYKLMVNNE